MVEMCDVCRKKELKQTSIVEFSFEQYHIGEGLLSPWKCKKIRACSIKCFEKWYKKFKEWYDNEVNGK